MPGQNTSGTPNTEDYTLGRGRIFAAPIDATTGRPLGYRFLGNAPAVTSNISTETLEHQASTGGLKNTDKEIVISVTPTLNFTLDEINAENLKSFFLGESNYEYVNVAAAGFAQYEMIAPADFEGGRSYDIVNSLGELAMGVQGTDLTVVAGGTTLVLNTDYTFDYEEGVATQSEMGQIFFIADSPAVIAAKAANEGIDVTLAANGAAKDIELIDGLKTTGETLAILFIQENPASADAKLRFEFHSVNVKPDGDFSGIGDDWSTLQYTGKMEKNSKLGGKILSIKRLAA